MYSRDYRDMLGGALVILAGILTILHVAGTLRLGVLRSMGPGLFPASIGVLLVIFGLLIFIPALLRPGVMPQFRIWTPFFVFGGILAFGLLVVPFGLIPAVLTLTVVSALAELRVQPVSLVLLVTIVCTLAWLVYVVGLGLNAPLFRWPF